jgi:hypothetical protein
MNAQIHLQRHVAQAALVLVSTAVIATSQVHAPATGGSAATPTAAPTAGPTATPTPPAESESPSPDPTASPTPSPTSTPEPAVTAAPHPHPSLRAPLPIESPRPTPKPQVAGPRIDFEPGGPTPAAPSSLNLFHPDGFRYQDPNYAACTATSALVMLNTIALNGDGGTGFTWTPRWGQAAVNSILEWERSHDTLAGGNGSDPHGWRNALNYYGYGSGALYPKARVYEDLAYTSYHRAVKTAVRQLIRHQKPVGIVAWSGRHAQFITGYAGLKGDPFARVSSGAYANDFTVDAVYLSDPLKADGWVNAKVAYETLRTTSNPKLRFSPYLETDSPYDDKYTAGVVPAKSEWHGHWVIIAPLR